MNHIDKTSADKRITSESQNVDQDGTTPSTHLFDRLLLPIASEADAESTCEVLRPYIGDQRSHLIVVHVIERTVSYPDKAPLDLREEQADSIFDTICESFADTVCQVSTEIRYGPNVVEEIFAAADDADATAIGFTPRSGRHWVRVLSGDISDKLIRTSRRPIIVFPSLENEVKAH